MKNKITLIELLKYSKSIKFDNKEEFSWKDLIEVLGPIYSHDMKIKDVIHIVYIQIELLKEEELFKLLFQVYYTNEKILTAPINNFSVPNSLSLESKLSIEDFYNKILLEMIYIFRFSKVDWCRDILYPVIEKEET